MSGPCLVSGTAGLSTSFVSPVGGSSSSAGPATTKTTTTSNRPPVTSVSEVQPVCTGGEMSGPCVLSGSGTISTRPSTTSSSALNSTVMTTVDSLPLSSSRLPSENSVPICTGEEMSGPCIVSGTAGTATSTPSALPTSTGAILSTQTNEDISTSSALPWCTGGLMSEPCILSGSLGTSTSTPTTSPIWTNATRTAEATSGALPICTGGDMDGPCVATGTTGSVSIFSPGPFTSTVEGSVSTPGTSPTRNSTTPAALPGPSSIALPVCVDGLMSGPCIVIGTAGLSKSTPGVTAAVPTVAECSQSPLPPSSPSLNDTSPLSGYPPKTTSPLYGPTAAIPSTTVTSNSTSSSLEIATSLVDALRGSQAQSTAWSSNQTDSISSSPSTTTTTHIATVFADAPESPSSTSSSGDMPGWSGSTTSWGEFQLFLFVSVQGKRELRR